MSNLTQAQQKPKFSVAVTTKGYQNLINNTLGDPQRARRFVSSITSAVAVNPQLQECDAGTILAGALLGESLNLSPSPQLGQYYLVPFNDRKSGVKKAQFILGYKGYIQLALRSGSYADLDVMEIKQGEYLGKDAMTGKPKFNFIEDDEMRDGLPTIGYMAFFEYLNGFRKTVYWSKDKMMSHADKYSPAFSKDGYTKLQNGEIADKDLWKYSSFWYKDFDDMAKKTLLRHIISRWGVMSIEMQTAFERDSSVSEVGVNNEIITSEEAELPVIDTHENPQLQPDATDVKPQVNLDDLPD
ncbi:MAG: recombinase RecT [Ruminococcus sp.]|nr:recombinase RecT [Ruminococcus sp.]